MTSELPLSQVLLQRIEHDYEEQPRLRLTPPAGAAALAP